VSEDLEFAWATDSMMKWYENKIYHNAGVTEDMKDMFFKGKYINKDPFNEDFSHINKDTASYEYTKLITEARDWLNESINKHINLKERVKLWQRKNKYQLN